MTIQSYKNKLRKLIAIYNFPLQDILFLPNIQEWCEEYKIHENNPFRIAKILKNNETQQFLILISNYITDDMIDSVKSRMFEMEVQTKALKTKFDFLKHTILHELCHALNENFSEEECDKWAFQQMGIM